MKSQLFRGRLSLVSLAQNRLVSSVYRVADVLRLLLPSLAMTHLCCALIIMFRSGHIFNLKKCPLIPKFF